MINFDQGITADEIGQQGMLTPPWHLILPSPLSRAGVALHSTLYVKLINATLI
jgi:hypothetical protein